MKIYEIANELRLKSKDVLAKASSLGIEAKNHMEDLSPEDTAKLRAAYKGGTSKAPKPAAGKAKPTPEPGKLAETEKTDETPKTAVPKKVAPKRVPKSEIDAAQQNADGDSAETSKKAEKKPFKKAVLKVAYKDTGDDRDKTTPAKPESESKQGAEKPEAVTQEAAQPEAAKAEVAKPETVEKPEASQPETAKPETAEKPEVAQPETAKPETVEMPEVAQPEQAKPEAAEKPEVAQTEAVKPEDQKAEAQKPEAAKTEELEEKSSKNEQEVKSEQPKPETKAEATSQGDAKADKARTGRPAKETAKRTEKSAKAKPSADKAKQPTRGAASKQTAAGSGQDKGKKDAASRGDRGGNRRNVRRGEQPRNPILENNVLAKKPVRSRPRPKTQQKPEPEKAFDLDSLAPGTKIIKTPITVAGFAEQTEKTITDVIMTLMKLGVMANVNQNLDEMTVELLGEELEVPIYIVNDEENIEEENFEDFEDSEEDLIARPPIITVMGHVDHGKTSLLDAIRKTSVTKGEAGGITQHIGASEITVNGERIVFLDTPGHEAFTAMRARGAHVTDIAVLVVAADDGVMPQTIESISHARAAGVPIIVAINKMDKPGANPDRVKQELADQNVIVEDWGGDIISVPVSAKSGEGIVNLLEMILLQAEVLELRANPNRLAMGTVIEAYLDKSRGSVATLLVLNGTLESGMSIVAGMASGRIRVMTDFNGKKIRKALPATAVEITGLSEVPQAGDEFRAVREDKTARDIADNRKLRQREEIMARTSGASLDTLYSRISANEMKELNIIIKGDVQGSVGALTASLEKLSNEEVKVRIIHRGVGAITESDVMLANTSQAIIIGFNVRPSAAVTSRAENDGVEIRTYRVIYDAIGEVESAMKGLLDPEFREVVLGTAEIRETFKVPGAGVIGGAYVTDGVVRRNAKSRVVRDGIVIYEGNISSLKRFKDDAREVNQGFECGIGIENFNDIKVGDMVEAFIVEEIERE